MTDYTGRGGYYEGEAEREAEHKAKLQAEREAKPEWQEWNRWRRAFLSTRIDGMTVGQFLRGLDKLKEEPK